jgi:hypothetical protein
VSTVVPRAGKSGFETAISVPGNQAWFAVQALGSGGKVIGTSNAFNSGTRPSSSGSSGTSGSPTLVGGY